MGFGKTLRERYRFIRILVNAQKTVWYPVLFALLCTIAGLNDHMVYIPILWVLTVFILFSAIFGDDNKVFLPPLLMIFCSLGIDTDKNAFNTSNGELLSFFDAGAFAQMMAICAICVSALLLRLIADGSVKRAFSKHRVFSTGFILFDVAFLLNGVLCEEYTPINILFGVVTGLGFTVVYFLVSGMLENSEDAITYACYSMVATAYVAFSQTLFISIGLIREGMFTIPFGDSYIVNRGELVLGWGLSTVIAAVFVLGIPPAMYLAANKSASLFSYTSALLFLFLSAAVNSRSAMIVGIAAFIFCSVICCIKGKNRIRIRIYISVLAVLFAVVLIILCSRLESVGDFFNELIQVLRLTKNSDSGRFKLWSSGIEHFRSAPLFGVGFEKGGLGAAIPQNNIFSRMYHCILVQFPASMGAVGCISFLVHLVSVGYLCFKRPSANKWLLLSIPLMIIGMSLADNFFFYFNFQIYYCVFLACAEKAFREDLK